MIVLNNRGLTKETGRTLRLGGSQIWARKGRDFIATLLDPLTKMIVLWQPILLLVRKDEGHTFLSMEFESFYMEPTQGEVNHVDGQVPKPSVLDDLLGVSITWMDGGDRIECIHASAAGDQGHRPCHVVEVVPARVPTFDSHDQGVPVCVCQFFVSWETLWQCLTCKEWLVG
jgi:hypothetical protein